MLELEVLRAADVYAWFGCQKLTAQRLGCNQSTVSRRAREVGRLGLLRSEWGELDVLGLERRVHQRWRFSKATDLRVHAYRWINPTLRRQLPESWLLNPPEVSVTRVEPVVLLAERLIDALLAPWPLVADLDQAEFALIPLYSAPLLLLAPRGGQLCHDTALSVGDVAGGSRFGTLDFVPGAAVDCSRHLDQQLFAAAPAGGRSEAAAQTAEARIDQRYWGMPLTPLVRPDLVALDYRPPVSYSELLVCRREWSEHAELLRLLAAIRRALVTLPAPRLEREWIEVA